MASVFSARTGTERLKALGIVGLILLPLIVGGLLMWGLSAPTANLSRVTAAVVNDDDPVTINGKTVPLGREFAAGLIDGGSVSGGTSGGSSSSTTETASYKTASKSAATTPNNFNWVLTNDSDAKSGLKSGRYAAVVTIPHNFSALATSLSGPASSANQALIEVDTSPAGTFIDPALTQAITSAATASLNKQLTEQYLGNIYAGFNSINSQIGQAADGAASLAAGASSVSSGAQSLASGAASLATGLQSLDSGASSLASGLSTLDSQTSSLPSQTQQLAQGASGVAQATGAVSSSVSNATTSFAAVVAQICQSPGPGTVCDKATAALATMQAASQGAAQLAAGAGQVAAGNQQLANAMPGLVAGIGQASSGANQLASGASQSDAGGQQLSAGAANLAGGAEQVDSGAASLSQGLATAVQKIPTYSDSDIDILKNVVSQPVLADQRHPVQGSQSVPLFVIIALWIGSLVIALARRAVPARQLMTSVSSLSITLRTIAMDAILGIAQGLLVALVVPLALSLSPAQWLDFAALSMVAGAVFAILNHGLAAALGVVGRLIGVVIAIVALGVGLASTVPPVFAGIAGLFPTAPAFTMLRAAVAGDVGAAWLAAAACALFAVLGFALVLAGVIARRRVRVRDLRPVVPRLA
jgi:putative membrane protein